MVYDSEFQMPKLARQIAGAFMTAGFEQLKHKSETPSIEDRVEQIENKLKSVATSLSLISEAQSKMAVIYHNLEVKYACVPDLLPLATTVEALTQRVAALEQGIETPPAKKQGR